MAAANDDAAPTVPDPEPAAHGEDVAAPVCAPADDEPAETGAAWFERIIAENKAKRDDCEARAQKVAPLDSVPFKHSDGERFGIAGPCMSEPGRFRFSYFDSRGAIGHCTRDTLALAMWEALDLGYLYATEDTAAASPPATHSEPAPARPVYASDHLAWMDVENGRAEPDEYQARVIECFGEVKAGGLFYNSDTYPATAALMTARYGYPDWRGDRGQSDGVANPFGMDCYRANSVIRARAERERERGAAATFTVGQRFARLIFNDGKQRTAAELVTLDPAGFACKLKAKSGRNSVEVTCSAYALSLAVIRAEERGKVLAAKRASARPEPIAPMPAEPAPVPSKSEPDPVPLPGELVTTFRALRVGVAFKFDSYGPVWVRARGGFRPGCGGQLHSCAPSVRVIRCSTQDARSEAEITAGARHAASLPSESDNAAPVAKPRDGGMNMLQTILTCLQRVALDGMPTSAMLESEAARVSGTAEKMRETMPDYAATCAEVARRLREAAEYERERLAPPIPADIIATVAGMCPIDRFDYLADYTNAEPCTTVEKHPEAMRAAILADIARTGPEVFRDRIAEQRGEADDDDETIPAPLDGLDVAELDDMVEFERAGGIAQPIAPAYRDDAPRATPTPSLRISPSDPRARIPARFAPVYLLQA